MADILFGGYLALLVFYLMVTYHPYFKNTRFKLWLKVNGVAA